MSSFDDILGASVVKKTEEVKIKSGGKDITFTAREISYTERLKLAVVEQSGGDTFASLTMFSIHDADGKRMTLDQFSRLSDEHQEAFFIAASKVNAKEPEKN